LEGKPSKTAPVLPKRQKRATPGSGGRSTPFSPLKKEKRFLKKNIFNFGHQIHPSVF